MTKDKSKRNSSWFKKGVIPWNTGKSHSKETREKIRLKAIGRPSPFKGKKRSPCTEETKRKLSKAMKGRIITPEWRRKIGEANKGKKCPWLIAFNKTKGKREAMRKSQLGRKVTWGDKISKSKKGKLLGKESCNWKGGKSFESYGILFTKELKEEVRKRDKYCCQECHRHQDKITDKNGKHRLLDIHHIDYNKKNNNKENLISLCRGCHAKTNFDRKNWINYYKNKITAYAVKSTNDRRK